MHVKKLYEQNIYRCNGCWRKSAIPYPFILEWDGRCLSCGSTNMQKLTVRNSQDPADKKPHLVGETRSPVDKYARKIL